MTIDKYCGNILNELLVAGEFVVITFHSDDSKERRGYRIYFTTAQSGKRSPQTQLFPANRVAVKRLLEIFFLLSH